MLAHRLRRWPSIKPALVQRLVLAGLQHWFGSAYCWWRVQADTDQMTGKYWASLACDGQNLFSPSQYYMLAVPARCFEPKLGYSNCWPAVCDAGQHSAWRQT